MTAQLGIVIPAHDEERGIGRLLVRLLADAAPGEFDVVVVCNGCTDGTARAAAAYGPAVRVVETPAAGKHRALRLGDEHTDTFPRIYLDADVELGASDIRGIADAVRQRVSQLRAPAEAAEPEAADALGSASPPVLAAAPERRLARTGVSWRVRWFYEIWLRLPGVRDGLYGRGVIALSEEGWRRIAELPPLMGDDLAVSALFQPHERRIVTGAIVVIHPPRTWADLIRRRIRAMTATAQFEQSAVTTANTRTGKSDLLAVLRAEPRLAPHVVLFAAVAVISRRKARRAIASGDFSTWLRDDSSRGGDSHGYSSHDGGSHDGGSGNGGQAG